MAHIEQMKIGGKIYLRICENVYISGKNSRKRVLKNIGPLSRYDDGKPDFLKRFREQFRKGEITFPDINLDKSKNTEKQNLSTLAIEPLNYGYLFLDNLFRNLGIATILNQIKHDSKIQYDLLGIVKLLVFGRILNPGSKKHTIEEFKDHLFAFYGGNGSIDMNSLYRALSVLNSNTEAIQKRIDYKITHSTIGRENSLTYYDVTNYYFETMYGDDDIYEIDKAGNPILHAAGKLKGKPIVVKTGIRKSGVSKENRKEPIVQMGLFIDNQGIPVSFNLFPGNTQDKTTFKEMLESGHNWSKSKRSIVVADAGMHAQGNLYLLTEPTAENPTGNGYIVSKSVKQSWNKIRDWVLDEDGYRTIPIDTATPIDHTSNNNITFKVKSRIHERTLEYVDKSGIKHQKTIKEKKVIYWSRAHYLKELHESEKFLEYLESCKEHPDKLKDKQRKSQEFIKVIHTDKKTGKIINTRDVVILLEDKIKKYRETMGYYMICTSEIEMPDEEVIHRYKGLVRIEDSFRILKSDLVARPVYVSTEEHIRAHFLICFIALTMIRLIQVKALKYDNKSTLSINGWSEGMTAKNIQEALGGLKTLVDKHGNCKFEGITDNIEKLFNIYQIDNTVANESVAEIKELRKRILDANTL